MPQYCDTCEQCVKTSHLVATDGEAVSQFSATMCTTQLDTVCANCTKCAVDEYVNATCTSVQNTVCSKCSACNW
jgi:hypothetical protein